MKKEGAGYDFGDFRLKERAEKIQARFSGNSGRSFPNIFRNYSELEGFYRFVNNPNVDIESLTKPIIGETYRELKKQTARDSILILHDTTVIEPLGVSEIEGLGKVSQLRDGFLAHFSIAVNSIADKRILGLAALKLWTRTTLRNKKKRSKEIQKDPQRESLRWFEQAEAAEKLHKKPGQFIHIMDREADAYWMFDELIQSGFRFVIRMRHDRPIVGFDSSNKDEPIKDVLAASEAVFTREVLLSTRSEAKKPRTAKFHPARKQRQASLSVRASQVDILRSQTSSKDESPMLNLNIVEVYEKNPPGGEKPIQWKLVTSEPIHSKEDLEHIVDSYRSRWVIEEFFKALKTGCQFEKRQFESAEAWYNCLGLFIPIAIKIYNLREHAKNSGNAADDFFTLLQRKLLTVEKKQLNFQTTTTQELMFAVAALGGHIKYNGPPGWLTLMRGYEYLLVLEQGYTLAQSNM